MQVNERRRAGWRGPLVRKRENFIRTLIGQVNHDGLRKLMSKNHGDKNVQQVLVNFQMKPSGGDGELRLFDVTNDGKSNDVIDYFPTRY